jgi:phage-related protein
MANFNTDVNIIPDRGLSTEQSPRILSAKYGDGYEQRIAAGINNIPESWRLTWKSRTKADSNKIIKFLEDQGGVTAFDWYPPDSEIASSTTSATTSKLIDTTQYFTNRYLNSTVTDSAAGTATVTAVDSATTLSLSSDLMSNQETYTIYPYKKYVCNKWNVTTPVLGYKDISATFIRVFEP